MEKAISSKVVHENPVFKVEEAEVELPDGKIEKRWYVVRPDAVVIVPITKEGRVILLKEYRSAAGEKSWRLPSGRVKEGESPEEAAQRELREETGFRAGNLKELYSRKNPSATIKQTLHFFLAKDLQEAPLDSGEYADIEVVPMKFSEARKLAKSGELKFEMSEALLKVLNEKT